MSWEEIDSMLNKIRSMTARYAKPDGTVSADAIRVKTVLEFCANELEQTFMKGQQVQD